MPNVKPSCAHGFSRSISELVPPQSQSVQTPAISNRPGSRFDPRYAPIVHGAEVDGSSASFIPDADGSSFVQGQDDVILKVRVVRAVCLCDRQIQI